jgi:PPE family protein
MPQISVDPDSLAADGAALMDCQTGVSAPGCGPASAHSTSVGVSANLTAQSKALELLVNHGQQVRSEGGAAHVSTAASFRATEDGNTALIAGNASASGAVSAPMPAASATDPVLPGIPPMSPLAPMTGEAHATALHSGQGSGSLRTLADYWTTQAASFDNIAGETSQTAAAVDEHWSDSGVHTAGKKTAVHGNWWSEMAGHARSLASAANDAADQHDQAVATTPTPQQFTAAHTQLQQAQAANQASGGLLSGLVSQAAAFLALLQSQATEALTGYHVGSTAAVNSTGGSGTTAPSIGATGGTGAAASATQSGTATVNGASASTNSTGLGQLLSNSGLGSMLGGGNAGNSSTAQMMQSMLPEMSMLPMMGMMGPMSAMSGLGGLGNQSRQNTLTGMESGAGGMPGGAAMDGGLAGDMGDTLPAAGGGGGVGGGVEATGDAGAALPMASTSHASPTPVSGPAAPAGIPADTAGTAPASAPRGAGGMSTMPPMMGAPGGGDPGSQRNMQLFPDRRMVSRPTPNSEAVFGELERERRPRGKRAAKEDGANDR